MDSSAPKNIIDLRPVLKPRKAGHKINRHLAGEVPLTEAQKAVEATRNTKTDR